MIPKNGYGICPKIGEEVVSIDVECLRVQRCQVARHANFDGQAELLHGVSPWKT